MRLPDLSGRKPIRDAALVGVYFAVCAVVLLQAAVFQRPAWGALGILIATSIAVRALRGAMPLAAALFAGLAVGPLAISFIVAFTETWSSWGTPAIVIGVALLLGCLLMRMPRAAMALLVAWHLALLAPVDVAFATVHDGPRVLPLQMGLLNEAGRTAADREEFVSGGCVVSGLEPRWVLAW